MVFVYHDPNRVAPQISADLERFRTPLEESTREYFGKQKFEQLSLASRNLINSRSFISQQGSGRNGIHFNIYMNKPDLRKIAHKINGGVEVVGDDGVIVTSSSFFMGDFNFINDFKPHVGAYPIALSIFTHEYLGHFGNYALSEKPINCIRDISGQVGYFYKDVLESLTDWHEACTQRVELDLMSSIGFSSADEIMGRVTPLNKRKSRFPLVFQLPTDEFLGDFFDWTSEKAIERYWTGENFSNLRCFVRSIRDEPIVIRKELYKKN